MFHLQFEVNIFSLGVNKPSLLPPLWYAAKVVSSLQKLYCIIVTTIVYTWHTNEISATRSGLKIIVISLCTHFLISYHQK